MSGAETTVEHRRGPDGKALPRLARAVWQLAPDLATIAALSAATLALVAAAPAGLLGLVRVALGLPFVLFYPGYCLQSACFPGRDELDGPQRLALSFGLSVATVPPVALLLDKLPWGIRTWPILLSLVVVMLLAGAVAGVRRTRLTPAARPSFSVAVDVPGWWAEQDRTNRILFTVFGLAVLTAFISAGVILFSPKLGERFTEFYMLGPEGLAENYPREAAAGQPVTVTVGIINREGVAASYRVQASVGEQAAGALPLVTLEAGQTWETTLTLTLPDAGDDQLVEIDLWRDELPEPYRRLRLWLNVTAPE